MIEPGATPRAKRSRKAAGTRDHVITVSLSLFNARGPDRVTTSQIAEAAGINEGNLYYYFKTKQALILTIFDRFEESVDQLLNRSPGAGADPAAYVAFLTEWFEIVWTYRFLYRDFMGLIAMAPELRRRIRTISDRIRSPVRQLIGHMRGAGLMELSDDALDALLHNLWIVSTYWVVYLDVQEGVRAIKKAHLEWGLRQVASLFQPHLTEAARHWLAAQADQGRPSL
ncbi:TetR/AcrR family transcriptional regulator [Microvirga terrae]|uniref:TetR/AcrR family transcriptional regulator n=1 Tax=Microvirga terrae TaxID=2740529 RepID=A0ABY5RZN5_9HYPH|nr:TetR/AcrR family transcriptional regulator [Microvirga terrae]UVF21754.1 TetR/AcrR family transcriptional regulator [Microvirga terrae]